MIIPDGLLTILDGEVSGSREPLKKKIVHPASKKATSYFSRRMLDFASSAQNGFSVDFWTVTENGQI